MEREGLERIITLFQAKARGFLIRKEFSGIRADYEDIVREIEGELSNLKWRGTILPRPYFTENVIVWQRVSSATPEGSGELHTATDLEKQPGEPVDKEPLDVQSPSESQVPEKDCSQHRESNHPTTIEPSEASTPPEGSNETVLHTSEPELNAEAQSKDEPVERGACLSLTEETSIWDSTAVDGGYSFLQKGSQHRSHVQDVPKNPEAMRLHRNNLAMELLWLQQAIASRKKYLLLKQKLDLPEQ